MKHDAAALLDDNEASVIAFWIGPAQPFIAGARSLRDLFLNSRILSWLTARAMRPIYDDHGAEAFLTPFVEGDLFGRGWPNRFVAVIRPEPEGSSPEELAALCAMGCRKGWHELAGSVKRMLTDAVASEFDTDLAKGWDPVLWDQQVEDYPHVETATVPVGGCDRASLERLLGQDWDATRDDADAWGRIELVLRLIDARKAAAHFPAYAFANSDVPQKCTLLGSYEQMGPGDHGRTAGQDRPSTYWEQFTKKIHPRGTHLRKHERHCAISLVKRFAWAGHLEGKTDAAGAEDREAFFPDTATIAAVKWLAEGEPLDPRDVYHAYDGKWSGQWLHWLKPVPEQGDDEDSVPPDVWQLILRKRRPKPEGQGWPPAYFAILTMDADQVHRWLQGEMTPRLGPGELLRPFSRALGRFASEVCGDVVDEQYWGRLIYAGGDEVLAFLRADAGLECAATLNGRFRAKWNEDAVLKRLPVPATLSAGIAIVHNKEDLRFALRQAREAEELAKEYGGDALAVAVIRRSGEHSRVVIPWEVVDELRETFLDPFRDGASDRWVYRLRAEEPTLRELTAPAIRAEIGRLATPGADADQNDKPPVERARVVGSWEAYRSAMSARSRPKSASGPDQGPSELADFVTVAQTMSFLSRGKD
jgi:CRISPR-associated protein Cmr2